MREVRNRIGNRRIVSSSVRNTHVCTGLLTVGMGVYGYCCCCCADVVLPCCCLLLGSYTADYTTNSTHAGRHKASGGDTVEEKNAHHTTHNRSGGGGADWSHPSYGGSGWIGRVVWDALVLLVGVALGVCGARAYGGYERRGEYQPIDRA